MPSSLTIYGPRKTVKMWICRWSNVIRPRTMLAMTMGEAGVVGTAWSYE